jgi:hypothetical protein
MEFFSAVSQKSLMAGVPTPGSADPALSFSAR